MASFVNFKKLANQLRLANQFGDGTNQDPIPQITEIPKENSNGLIEMPVKAPLKRTLPVVKQKPVL